LRLTIPRKSRFTTTHWSVVRAAAGTPSADAHEAMTRLCESYWYPLYAFLRRRGHSADDAQDLTQAFFARLLEKRALRLADPARGLFRTFLLTAVKNFAANEWQRQVAQKRGGRSVTVSLDFETAEGRFQREPATNETPEKVFDRVWALTLLERAIGQVRAEFGEGGKGAQFERLAPYLTGDQRQPSYAETGTALGLTEGAVKVAVHRMRQKFRDALRDEIAKTVSTDEEMEDELRHLRNTLGG
jgi:RNA polymerase sigma factor (sigma-70 family)